MSGIIEVCSFSIFLCMSPMRLEYKELGLELFEPLQYRPRQPQQSPMAEEINMRE